MTKLWQPQLDLLHVINLPLALLTRPKYHTRKHGCLRSTRVLKVHVTHLVARNWWLKVFSVSAWPIWRGESSLAPLPRRKYHRSRVYYRKARLFLGYCDIACATDSINSKKLCLKGIFSPYLWPVWRGKSSRGTSHQGKIPAFPLIL